MGFVGFISGINIMLSLSIHMKGLFNVWKDLKNFCYI